MSEIIDNLRRRLRETTRPVKETIEEPVDKPVDETVDELAEEVVKSTVKKPVKKRAPQELAVATSYKSAHIAIAPGFLVDVPTDVAGPITSFKYNFAESDLPEYDGCYAVVLDNVLSPSECLQLISYAQQAVSVDPASENTSDGAAAWKPAMVNLGGGIEQLQANYRNSDRIIWDDQRIVDRIWNRILQVDGLQDDLAKVVRTRGKKAKTWTRTRPNERMRFLRYGKGQFFKPHVDAPYEMPGKDERTFYTLQLYLNDSVQSMRDGKKGLEFARALKASQGDRTEKGICLGGATSFLSRDSKRRIDVDPKAGRALVFQHDRLLHSGDTVDDGIKFTMRNDLQFAQQE